MGRVPTPTPTPTPSPTPKATPDGDPNDPLPGTGGEGDPAPEGDND